MCLFICQAYLKIACYLVLGTCMFFRLVEENGEFFRLSTERKKRKKSIPLFHTSKSIQKQAI